jgi:quinol monooxygenase YgiN
MLIVILRLSVPPHTTSHVIDLFESYRGPVSVQPGCRSIHLYSHFAKSGDFMLMEEWNSPDALYNHVRSDDFRKVLALMDLAATAPDLSFLTVSSARGFDLVEELRQKGKNGGAGRV